MNIPRKKCECGKTARTDIGDGTKCYECNRVVVYCSFCGKEKTATPYNVERNKHHFCNRKCKYEYFQGENAPTYRERKTCIECGKVFFLKRQQRNARHDVDQRFCSFTCQKKIIVENKWAYADTYYDQISYADPTRIVKVNGIGILETKCTNCNVWFRPTVSAVRYRSMALTGKLQKVTYSEMKLYCSDDCKSECPCFGTPYEHPLGDIKGRWGYKYEKN
jgi:hypothetical protein